MATKAKKQAKKQTRSPQVVEDDEEDILEQQAINNAQDFLNLARGMLLQIDPRATITDIIALAALLRDEYEYLAELCGDCDGDCDCD